LLPKEPLTIPGKDGDGVPLYLERSIQRVTKKLSEMENSEKNEENVGILTIAPSKTKTDESALYTIAIPQKPKSDRTKLLLSSLVKNALSYFQSLAARSLRTPGERNPRIMSLRSTPR
jgi:hypothetical protein